MAVARWILLALLSLFFVFGGVNHFIAPGLYAQMVPPWLPAPLGLVYVSGVAEIAGGIGLLIPATRRLAAFGLIALLIAVFPANLYMATSNVQLHDMPAWMSQPTPTFRWVRLPFQALFIGWAWLFARKPALK
jgi:uncharacterized membrane protein